jgi:hypothetical protein
MSRFQGHMTVTDWSSDTYAALVFAGHATGQHSTELRE